MPNSLSLGSLKKGASLVDVLIVPGSEYLTVRETGRFLGVTTPRVFQMIRAGQLRPAIRVGRSYGFTLEHVDAVRRARKESEHPQSAA